MVVFYTRLLLELLRGRVELAEGLYGTCRPTSTDLTFVFGCLLGPNRAWLLVVYDFNAMPLLLSLYGIIYVS